MQAQPDPSPKQSGVFSISGAVWDTREGTALELATVSVRNTKAEAIQSVWTDKEGKFTAFLPKAGKYVLKISFLGSEIFTSDTLDIQAQKDLGRILVRTSTNSLNEVVVKARKALIENKGDKLIYNAAADISNKSGSATDVLRKAPMITVGANGEVKMRGSSNIKVLLNGLPSGIFARSLTDALKAIPASTIESVEVITSPSAKYEAEGAAGVINIVTRKNVKGTNGTINASAGNLEQSLDGNVSRTKGRFDYGLNVYLSQERERSVNNLERTTLNEGKKQGLLTQRSDGLEKNSGSFIEFVTGFRPDSLQKISLSASVWRGRWPNKSSLYNRYLTDKEVIEYNQTSNQRAAFHYAELGLDYSRKFKRTGQELQVIFRMDRSEDNSSYVTDQFRISGDHYFRERSPNKSKSRDYSLQVDYAHPLGNAGKNFLETGVRFSKTNSSSDFTVFNNIRNPGSEDLTEDPSRANNMAYFQNVYAGYLSLQFETRNSWRFRPGLRYENTRLGGTFKSNTPSFENAFGNWVPNVLISKKINEHHEIKLNYTERIRRPWIWDLNPYVNASDPRNLTFGNPQLRPEITRMLEATHSFSAESGLLLNSSVFYSSNSNAMESLTTVDSIGISRTTTKNIASNRRLGANLNAYCQLSEAWNLSVNTEMFHVWFRSSALNVANNGTFYSIGINSSYNLPKDYSIQVSGDYGNGFITLQGRTSANYSYRFTARKEFWNKKASVTLNINNPFQRAFVQTTTALAPSFDSKNTIRHYNRSFAVSLSWIFGGVKSYEDKDDKRFSDQQSEGKNRQKR